LFAGCAADFPIGKERGIPGEFFFKLESQSLSDSDDVICSWKAKSSELLRNLIKRERPKADTTSLLPWQNNSFPSYHALRISMLATLFGTSYPSCLPLLIIGAIIVSISRIYLERHYPFDVVAGSLIGFLCTRFVLFIF
jgi:membrane-associated phospholipid phosphatase